jgi:hypothetical protein
MERDTIAAAAFRQADEYNRPGKIRANDLAQDLAAVCRRRAASGMRAAGAGKCCHLLGCGRGIALELSAKTCRRGHQRMSRHQHRKCRSVIERASERSRKARRRIDAPPGPHGHDLRVHCAVVRPVPPAARRQACVRAAVDEGRQRPQPEKQHEKNGEAAPHLKPMLADGEEPNRFQQIENNGSLIDDRRPPTTDH